MSRTRRSAMATPRGITSRILLLCVALTVLLSLSPTSVRAEGVDATTDMDPCSAQLDGGVSASGSRCHINCFRADPVCGVDGVTYWCGCPDAACAGVRVAKRGACQVGSGGSGLVSGQAFLLHIIWLVVLGFMVLFGNL